MDSRLSRKVSKTVKKFFVGNRFKKIGFRALGAMLMGCIALGVTFFSAPHIAHAFCSFTIPCVQIQNVANGSITINWYYEEGDSNVESVDGYNIRWSANDGPQTQNHIDTNATDASFTINNVNPDAYYGFIVQACETHVLSSSNCTGWSRIVYYAPYGPDTCLAGFVWRNAYPNDVTCVSRDDYNQAQKDNSLAPFRINPNGAYGPDTCINGYIWREADSNVSFVISDHVCVTRDIYNQTQRDNSQADAHKLFP